MENIENKLREAKLLDLLFPVVVASMMTVWGYSYVFFFDEFDVVKIGNEIIGFHFASNEVSPYIKKLEFAIMVAVASILGFISFCIYRMRSSYK